MVIATQWVVPAPGVQGVSGGVCPDIEVTGEAGAAALGVPPERQVGGRPLTDKGMQDRELIRRVAEDPTLSRAADILIGLKALGRDAYDTGTTTNKASADRP
jgi:hypothetical protein